MPITDDDGSPTLLDLVALLPRLALEGTVKVIVRLELEVPVEMMVFEAICSPESVSEPLRL